MDIESNALQRMVITASIIALLLIVSLKGNVFFHEVKEESEKEEMVLEVGSNKKYVRIQDAIDAALDGAVILVDPGEYYENLFINKGLDIHNATNGTVTLHPPPTRGDRQSSRILIASVTPTTTEGLMIEDAGTGWDDYAVKIQDGNGHIIRNCILKNCKQGVWVHSRNDQGNIDVENIVIDNNLFQNIEGHGVYLQWAGGCTVEKNTFENCGDGITIAHNSSGNDVNDNDFKDCKEGIVLTENSIDSRVRNNDFEDCDYGIYILDGSPDIHDNSFISISDNAIYGVIRKSINDNLMVDVAGGIMGYVSGNVNIDNNDIICELNAIALEVSPDADLSMDNNKIDHSGNTAAIAILGGGTISLHDIEIETESSALYVENSTELRMMNSMIKGDISTSGDVVSLSGMDGVEMDNVDISGKDRLCFIGNSKNIEMINNRFDVGGGDGLILEDSEMITLSNSVINGVCDVAVTLDGCVDAKLDGITANGTISGFNFLGEKKEHFIHSVKSSCTANGLPVYYHVSENNQIYSHTDAAQIILADTIDCSVIDTKLHNSHGIMIAFSTSTSISNCRLNSTIHGLEIIESEETSIENTIITAGDDSDNCLLVRGSTVSAMDSSFKSPSSINAVKGEDSSVLDLFNTTYTSCDMGANGGARLNEHFRLQLTIRYSDNRTPVEGADVLIKTKTGSSDIYSTKMYGGNDPRTDFLGSIPCVWVLSRYFDHNNSPREDNPFEVCAYFQGEKEWSNSSTYRINDNYHLYLVTSDIRRPPKVNITSINPLQDGDALNITWNVNTDAVDDIHYFVLYSNILGEWEPILEGISPLNRSVILDGEEYGMIHNETYYFKMIAVDEVGFESEPGNMTKVVHKDHLAPEAPTALRVNSIDLNSINVSWNESSSNDTTGYALYIMETNSSSEFVLHEEYDNGTNTAIVKGVQAETTYRIRIMAFDEAKNPSTHNPELNLTTPRSVGYLNITVKDSEKNTVITDAFIEVFKDEILLQNETGRLNGTNITLYNGIYEIRVSCDNYTQNSSMVEIFYKETTDLVIHLKPIKVNGTETDDDNDEENDDHTGNEENGYDLGTENRSNRNLIWFLIFALIAFVFMVIVGLLLVLKKKRSIRRRKEKKECTPVPVSLSPRPPPMPDPAVNYGMAQPPPVPFGMSLAPKEMHPYVRIPERLALPMHAGETTDTISFMTEPSIAGSPLEDIFSFTEKIAGTGYSLSPPIPVKAPNSPQIITGKREIPAPRIVGGDEGEPEETKPLIGGGVTLGGTDVPSPMLPPPDQARSAASILDELKKAGETKTEKEPSKETEISAKLKSLIRTIERKKKDTGTVVDFFSTHEGDTSLADSNPAERGIEPPPPPEPDRKNDKKWIACTECKKEYLWLLDSCPYCNTDPSGEEAGK